MKNITNKTKTILFASLIAAMILPFSGMQSAQAEEQTENELAIIAELDPAFVLIGERTLKIEERIIKVNERLERAEANGNDFKVEKLTELLVVLDIRLANLIIAGEALGYMHSTTASDPDARVEFYNNHPPEGTEDGIESRSHCECQVVKANMGYEYPTGYGYDGSYYLAPASYQTLTKNVPKDFSANVHATLDYIKPFAVFDTAKSASETVKATYDLGLTSSDEEEETVIIYSFWAHRLVIATETNVSSGVNLQGTAEWK
jgi:hypothetical protein